MILKQVELYKNKHEQEPTKKGQNIQKKNNQPQKKRPIKYITAKSSHTKNVTFPRPKERCKKM